MSTEDAREAAIRAALAAAENNAGRRYPCNGRDGAGDDLRAAIQAYERNLWQPIAMAPKDGCEIITANDTKMDFCSWFCIHRSADGFWMNGVNHATHWRPVPEFPETGGA